MKTTERIIIITIIRILITETLITVITEVLVAVAIVIKSKDLCFTLPQSVSLIGVSHFFNVLSARFTLIYKNLRSMIIW